MTKPKAVKSFISRTEFWDSTFPTSLVKICADDADASFLGLNPGSSTFGINHQLLLGRKVSLHLFIEVIAYFAFWMGIATS